MKKLLILFICLLFINCKEKDVVEINTQNKIETKEETIDLSKNISNKIKVGDVVYIKPDSTKVVIDNLDGCNSKGIYVIWFDTTYGYRRECINQINIYLKE